MFFAKYAENPKMFIKIYTQKNLKNFQFFQKIFSFWRLKFPIKFRIMFKISIFPPLHHLIPCQIPTVEHQNYPRQRPTVILCLDIDFMVVDILWQLNTGFVKEVINILLI